MKKLLIGCLVLVALTGVMMVSGCNDSLVFPDQTTTTISNTTTSSSTTTTTTATTTTTTTTTTTATTLPDFAFTQKTAAAFSSGGRRYHTSVVFDNKMWTIAGYMSSPYQRTNEVWSTTDGQNWTLETAEAAFLPCQSHSSVVFDNKMWVMGGYVDGGKTSEVWSSSDGITWISATPEAAFGQRASHSSVVFDGRMWVIGGEGSSGSLSDVYSSGDGITWIQETAAAGFGERKQHASTVHDGKMWVIAGNLDGTLMDDTWYSADGITWIEAGKLTASGLTASTSEAARGYPAVVTYTLNGIPRIFITGGYNTWGGTTNRFNDLRYSSDGASWVSAEALTTYPSRDSHTSVVFNDKIWVIGGYDGTGTFLNDAWYSPKL